MRLEALAYPSDGSLIAQHPIEPRARARPPVVDRRTGALAPHLFADPPPLLRPNALLVLNDTQVIPARLPGHKRPSGGKVEVLLVRQGEQANHWHALVRGHVRTGQQVELPHGILASVTTAGEGGHAVITFPSGLDVLAYAEKAGQVPLPPYIHRAPVEDDRIHYQTVFARRPGAGAAPTAGLHFTEPLLQALTAQGVRTGYVTLHVGPGTFKPVTCEDIRRHVMDPEWYELPAATAKLVNETRAAGGRIVAVGSTAVRGLETAGQNGGPLEAGAGEAGLFIYPGFRFSVVDVLLTHFHLPKSTLFMPVCALAGLAGLLEA